MMLAGMSGFPVDMICQLCSYDARRKLVRVLVQNLNEVIYVAV